MHCRSQAGGATYVVSNEEVTAGEVDKLTQNLLKIVTDVSPFGTKRHNWGACVRTVLRACQQPNTLIANTMIICIN